MKSLNVKLLAVAALALTALCASSMWATGTGAQATGSSKFYRLVAVTGAEGYDLQWTDGRVVGMRALREDGGWFDLRPYVPPRMRPSMPSRSLKRPAIDSRPSRVSGRKTPFSNSFR